MKKWILRVTGALVTAIAILALLAFMTLRASLPQLDGEVVVTGLTGQASIARDADGIATITAATRGDVAYATGFAHAQDRFFQMDLIRRQSAGELSELLGESTVAYDKRVRLHRFRTRAGQAVKVLPRDDMELLERYADGVNDGLESLGAKPFEYFLLGAEPEPWAAEDTVLVAYTMFLMLNDERADRDLQRGLASLGLPAAVFDFMYPEGTSWDAPLMGDVREQPPIPPREIVSLREFDGEAPPAGELGKPDLPGSNNWAVSGELTGTGAAMVSNDMHLGLRVPGVWYQARFVVESSEPRDVTGVTLPGTPFIVGGSNTRIAWGNTNSYGDWTDAIVLEPGTAPGTYRSGGKDLAFETHVETIEVRGADAEELVVRETIWGPVHDSIDYPGGEVAISWIAHDVDALNLNLADLETAGSVDEALAIANRMGGPPQNFVVGDSEGNIGWTIAGQIPVRTGYKPFLPADWSNGAGWAGWLDAENYPRVINPDRGRIWTANARVADGAALTTIGDSGYDLGARARQIRDALFEKDRFDAADMLAIQVDDRALFLSRWRDLLLEELDGAAVAGDADLEQYRDLVENWIPRAVPESTGYRLVRSFRLEVQSRVFHALTAPVRAEYGADIELRLSNQFEGPLWVLVSEQPEHLLPGQYDSWQELFVDAVRSSIRYFRANFGDDLADRTWGERNMASIRHPLSGAVPFFGDMLNMPSEPLAGDVDLPRAQGRTFGASQRFTVSPGDEANGIMHMPTGQSGHPLSEFYGKGHEDWVRGEPSPFLPGETRHTLLLKPGE